MHFSCTITRTKNFFMLLYLKRFLARLIDYGLFYFGAVLGSLMLPLEINDEFYFLFAVLVPLFWAPLEALFIKKWGTTPGKKIFGISVPHLSWKESFRRAFCWGKRPGTLEVRQISFWRYIVAFVIAGSLGSALFFGKDISEAAIHYEQQITGQGW